MSKRKPQPARNNASPAARPSVSDRPLPMLLQRAAMMGGGAGFLSMSIMAPGSIVAKNWRDLLMVAILLVCLRLGVPLKAPKRARLGYACAFLAGYTTGSLAVFILARINSPVLWSVQSVLLLLCIWGVRKSLRG